MNQNFPPEAQEAANEIDTQIEEKEQQETLDNQSSMEDLLEDEGLGIDFPRQGDIRKGTVARVTESEILVSIGTKSEGVIPSREVDQLDEEIREEISIGKEITVYVVNPEDQSGNILLSYVRALEEKDWLYAESLLASGEAFEGIIIGFNKGGVIIPVGQLRGFVPASQVSLLRRLDSSGNTPEQRWGSMIDEPITVSVIEVDRERRRLILSERVALQETRESLKERLLEELNEGDIREGRVTSLADFGAFVNIDGADGLVHLSEISWERIEHPREVLRVGQEVQVKVIGIDRERKRIGLSIRQMQEDPWVKKIGHINEGQLVEGTITHLTKFGAFARLDEDLEGLIHISEISEQRVAHPKEVLHEGDVVTLRVIKIEPERHRIGLSLRKVDSPAYTDFDWKMTLAEVVEETHGEDDAAVGGEAVVEEMSAEAEGESLEAEVAAEELIVEAEALVEEGPAVVEGESLEAEVAAEEKIVEAEVLVEEVPAEAEVAVEEMAAEAEVEAEEMIVEAEVLIEETSEEDEEAVEEIAAEAEGEPLEAEVATEEMIIEAEVLIEEVPAEEEVAVEEIAAEAEGESLEAEVEAEEMIVEAEVLIEETSEEDEEAVEEIAAEAEGEPLEAEVAAEEMIVEAETLIEEEPAEEEVAAEEIAIEVESGNLGSEEELEEMTFDALEELAEIEAREAEEMRLEAAELGEVFEEIEPEEASESYAEGEVEEDESDASDRED